MIERFSRSSYAFLLSLRNARFFFRDSPATPLRVGLITAFDYIALLHGISIPASRRNDAALFTDFASLLNKYYDGKTFDVRHYRKLRKALSPRVKLSKLLTQYRLTIKQLSQDKDISEADAIIFARELETRAIFKTLCQLFSLPIETQNISLTEHRTPLEKDITSLLRLGYLIQMYDDILDTDYDRKYAIPSYVTAFMFTKGRSKAQALYLCLQHAKRHLKLIAKTPSQAQFPLYIVGVCTYWLGRASSLRYHLGTST